MSDLEVTRACADAMGLWWVLPNGTGSEGAQYVWVGIPEDHPAYDGGSMMYDPLHDDAQAMALVKRFGLSLWQATWSNPAAWYCEYHGKTYEGRSDLNANRAICECVAKMQLSKGRKNDQRAAESA